MMVWWGMLKGMALHIFKIIAWKMDQLTQLIQMRECWVERVGKWAWARCAWQLTQWVCGGGGVCWLGGGELDVIVQFILLVYLSHYIFNWLYSPTQVDFRGSHEKLQSYIIWINFIFRTQFPYYIVDGSDSLCLITYYLTHYLQAYPDFIQEYLE